MTGDFDGNGKRDYALRILQNGRGYLWALLGQTAGFKTHILLRLSPSEISNYGMTLAKRGESYSIGDPYEDDAKIGRLPNDAPVIGPYGSHAAQHNYRDGRFGIE